MTALRGGEKRVNYHKFEIANKMCKHIFLLPSFSEVSHDIDMALIYYSHGYFIYRVCRIHYPGNFLFLHSNLAEILTNLAEIVDPHAVYGVTSSNSKDPWSLIGPGCQQVSSGVVVRIVEGKLNTDGQGTVHGHRDSITDPA